MNITESENFACPTCSLFGRSGCEKVDGRFSVVGTCEDGFEPVPHQETHGKRKTGRAYRRRQRVKKRDGLMRLIDCTGYAPWMGYVDHDYVDGKWVQTGKYIKYPKNSNAQSFDKRLTSKRVRQHKGSIPKGNAYRKYFDYWWDLL